MFTLHTQHTLQKCYSNACGVEEDRGKYAKYKMDGSCSSYEWVMSVIWKSHVPHMMQARSRRIEANAPNVSCQSSHGNLVPRVQATGLSPSPPLSLSVRVSLSLSLFLSLSFSLTHTHIHSLTHIDTHSHSHAHYLYLTLSLVHVICCSRFWSLSLFPSPFLSLTLYFFVCLFLSLFHSLPHHLFSPFSISFIIYQYIRVFQSMYLYFSHASVCFVYSV